METLLQQDKEYRVKKKADSEEKFCMFPGLQKCRNFKSLFLLVPDVSSKQPNAYLGYDVESNAYTLSC